MNVERMKAALDRANELYQEVYEWDEDAGAYAVYSDTGGKDYLDMGIWGRVKECGTAACFAGHLCLTPWFMEQGLIPLVNTFEDEAPDYVAFGGSALKPTFEGLEGYGALEAFFETNLETIDYIFGGFNLNDFTDLIRRINVVLKRYEGEHVFSE